MTGLRSLVALSLLTGLIQITPIFAEVPSGPGDWPQWRGPNRNGVSPETGLVREWPQEGPKVLWQVDNVGVGYSSMAVKDGLLITQGDLDGVEHVICLRVADGSLVWSVQPEPVAKDLTAKIEAEMKRLDTDSDGVIDEAEALQGLGPNFNNFDQADRSADAPRLAAERASLLFKKLDVDKDGMLRYSEAGSRLRDTFGRMDLADAAADAAALAKQRTNDAFQKDQDADGKLSRKEVQGTALQDAFGRADQKDPATNQPDNLLTGEEVETYFTRQEAGRDGLISPSELEKYLAANYPGKDGRLTAVELRGYLGGYRNSYGDGPRGTPTIDGKFVYAEGGNGDLTCFDLATGKTVWYINLSKNLGGGRPGWGYSESPLVVGELLIVTPGGGKGTLAALNKYTGEVVWRSEGVTEGAHYASPMVAEIAGVKQIVQFASRDVFGVQLDGGRLLWTYSKANNGTANVATPIIHQDHVFASSGYGTGGGLVKISNNSGNVTAEEVYFDKKLANHHGGVLLIGEHLYGFGNGGLICQHCLTGEIAWQARSVGKGSLVSADGLLFLLGENFEVALAEASSGGYREKGRFKIDQFNKPSWAHPVVAGGRLFIRNAHRLTAYDIRATQ